MKTLVLAGYGVKLGFRRGVFVIAKKGEPLRTVSPLELEQIIVVTSGVSITSRAIRACARLGIDLVVLDHRGDVIARLVPAYISRTVETRRLQYEAYTDERAVEISKWVLVSKLLNQAELLKYFAKSRRRTPEVADKLRQLALEIEHRAAEVQYVKSYSMTTQVREQLLSLEAVAARAYWEGVRTLLPEDLGFEKRDRESPDIVNLSLNYMYGLLKNTCMRAALLLNLDPFAGYLHVDKSGRPSLVLDLMEIFRPVVVDRVLITYLCANKDKARTGVENTRLKPEFRAELVRLFNTSLKHTVKYSSESVTLETLIYRTVKMLRDYLHGKTQLRPIHVKLC